LTGGPRKLFSGICRLCLRRNEFRAAARRTKKFAAQEIKYVQKFAPGKIGVNLGLMRWDKASYAAYGFVKRSYYLI